MLLQWNKPSPPGNQVRIKKVQMICNKNSVCHTCQGRLVSLVVYVNLNRLQPTPLQNHHQLVQHPDHRLYPYFHFGSLHKQTLEPT